MLVIFINISYEFSQLLNPRVVLWYQSISNYMFSILRHLLLFLLLSIWIFTLESILWLFILDGLLLNQKLFHNVFILWNFIGYLALRVANNDTFQILEFVFWGSFKILSIVELPTFLWVNKLPHEIQLWCMFKIGMIVTYYHSIIRSLKVSESPLIADQIWI